MPKHNWIESVKPNPPLSFYTTNKQWDCPDCGAHDEHSWYKDIFAYCFGAGDPVVLDINGNIVNIGDDVISVGSRRLVKGKLVKVNKRKSKVSVKSETGTSTLSYQPEKLYKV